METLLAAIVLMASVASAPEAPAKSEPLYLAVARRFVRFAGLAVKNAVPGRAVVTKTKGNTLTFKYPNGHEVTVKGWVTG